MGVGGAKAAATSEGEASDKPRNLSSGPGLGPWHVGRGLKGQPSFQDIFFGLLFVVPKQIFALCAAARGLGPARRHYFSSRCQCAALDQALKQPMEPVRRWGPGLSKEKTVGNSTKHSVSNNSQLEDHKAGNEADHLLLWLDLAPDVQGYTAFVHGGSSQFPWQKCLICF